MSIEKKKQQNNIILAAHKLEVEIEYERISVS